jgi:hypothetical protein
VNQFNHLEEKKGNCVLFLSESKVKAYIPICEPLKTETCKKCGKAISTSKSIRNLLRMVRKND